MTFRVLDAKASECPRPAAAHLGSRDYGCENVRVLPSGTQYLKTGNGHSVFTCDPKLQEAEDWFAKHEAEAAPATKWKHDSCIANRTSPTSSK